MAIANDARKKNQRRGERERGLSFPFEVEVVLKEAQDREKVGKETIRRRGSCRVGFSAFTMDVDGWSIAD